MRHAVLDRRTTKTAAAISAKRVPMASRQSWSAEKLLADYRQRGTMEGHLGELKSVMAPALSCALRGENRNGGKAGDPEFLATIKAKAASFSLAEGETKAVDVKLTAQP